MGESGFLHLPKGIKPPAHTMAIRSRGECLSPLAEVILLCLQALKIHHQRKGEKAGCDGFNESVTFRMVSGLCCSLLQEQGKCAQ